MAQAPIRIGVLGLGRAFTLMVPTLSRDPRVQLVAAHDPREAATAAFAATWGAAGHASAQALFADPSVEWIYVATPHACHPEHVQLAASHGKHVLVEKPMACTLDEARHMIEACDRAGTRLIVGHSHSFNAPVRLARQLIERGDLGAVRLVHAMNFTDFLYRPRRPEELDTAQGGGVVYSQAAHQVDIVRLLAGGQAQSVYARTGAWDPARRTEGAYTALLDFKDGAVANLTYSGYAYYDSDVLMDGIGEMGRPKTPGTHQATRQRLAAAQAQAAQAGGAAGAAEAAEAAEATQKARRNFGGPDYVPDSGAPAAAFQHFGPVIVCCERGDLRLTPTGVEVHTAQGVRIERPPVPALPRSEVIDELWSVAREGQPPVHSGAWSLATLEVCVALLASQRSGQPVTLHHQVRTDAPFPSPSSPAPDR